MNHIPCDIKINALEKEINDLRSYCMITFGESHPEMRKCPHEVERDAALMALKKCRDAFKGSAYFKPHDWVVAQDEVLAASSAIANLKKGEV